MYYLGTSSSFLDSKMRKRMDLVAKYDVKCSEMEDPSVYAVFLSAVGTSGSDLAEICSGGK